MSIGTLFSQLVAVAKNDAEKAALPILATFLTSIASNPSELNLVAQGGKALADLNAALPSIEQDLIKDLLTMIQAEAQAALAKPA